MYKVGVDIQLYDHSSCEQVPWPNTEAGAYGRSFFLPLMREGVNHHIANVKTQLYILIMGDLLLPLTVNEDEYDNSYIVSNYYAIHALEEKKKSPLQTPLIRLAGGVLKWLKVNRTVIVNNWLVTNNLLPEISAAEMGAITTFLSGRFPHHYLMFRNVTTFQGSKTLEALQSKKFHVIGARSICVYNPTLKESFSSKVHYHHRRDLRLIEKLGYEVVRKEGMGSTDIPRILELYRTTYCDGHTPYSPNYTELFLSHALQSSFFQFVGVKREGVLDAVFGYYTLDGRMATPFFGYDGNALHSGELYRMMTILIIKEAERLGVVLNDGSGGEASKTYRGMALHPEYVALYARHLSLPRRLFWNCVAKFT